MDISLIKCGTKIAKPKVAPGTLRSCINEQLAKTMKPAYGCVRKKMGNFIWR